MSRPIAPAALALLIVTASILFPLLHPLLLAAAFLLILYKIVDIGVGIWWIWVHGSVQTHALFLTEVNDPAITYDARNALLFRVFDKVYPKWAGWMGWRCLRQSEQWLNDPSFALFGFGLGCFRKSMLAFDAMIFIIAVLLFVCPVGLTGNIRLLHNFLLMANVIAVYVLISTMCVEILIGNAVMGFGYNRYYHRDVGESLLSLNDGKLRVFQIVYFVRLSALSLIALAASFFAIYLVYGGLCGVSVSAEEIDDWSKRATLFGEIWSFTITTFATVGYGDIAPDNLRMRIAVSLFHVLSMGMILVLLQVVLAHSANIRERRIVWRNRRRKA